LGICATGNVARKNEEIKGQVEEAAAETTENSASTELKPPQDKPIPIFSVNMLSQFGGKLFS
jgi:hypothetical protein